MTEPDRFRNKVMESGYFNYDLAKTYLDNWQASNDKKIRASADLEESEFLMWVLVGKLYDRHI